MKIKDICKMVLGIVLVIALVVLLNAKVDFVGVKNWFSTVVTTDENKTENDQLTAPTPTPMPTNDVATAPEATQEVKTVFTDENGKTYFVNSEEAYQNVSLQGRLDYAEITSYHVYDVLVDGDEIVKDANGNEITSRYGISLGEVKSVDFLRDGYTLLAYSYDEGEFRKDTSESHEFKGAKDSVFASKVLCTEGHVAIKATTRIGYINAVLWTIDGKYGCKGAFQVSLLDSRIFDAIVLAKRTIVVNGTTVNAYTWCMRVCTDGEAEHPVNGGNGDGGKPSDKPTAEPTIQPTAEPTTKPTHSPTEAPTTAPTEAPTTAPTIEPTVKPTHSPTEAPRPTHSPTEAPTAAPTKEPTQQPSYKPTPVPEVTPEPTNRHSDTGDEGSGNSHSPTDDDNSTSGGNRHSDASDSSTSNGNRHSEP